MRHRFVGDRLHRHAADLRLGRKYPPNPVALDGAGLDRVDANLERPKLDGERFGKADDGPFRGGIGCAQRKTKAAGRRR